MLFRKKKTKDRLLELEQDVGTRRVLESDIFSRLRTLEERLSLLASDAEFEILKLRKRRSALDKEIQEKGTKDEENKAL